MGLQGHGGTSSSNMFDVGVISMHKRSQRLYKNYHSTHFFPYFAYVMYLAIDKLFFLQGRFVKSFSYLK